MNVHGSGIAHLAVGTWEETVAGGLKRNPS